MNQYPGTVAAIETTNMALEILKTSSIRSSMRLFLCTRWQGRCLSARAAGFRRRHQGGTMWRPSLEGGARAVAGTEPRTACMRAGEWRHRMASENLISPA